MSKNNYSFISFISGEIFKNKIVEKNIKFIIFLIFLVLIYIYYGFHVDKTLKLYQDIMKTDTLDFELHSKEKELSDLTKKNSIKEMVEDLGVKESKTAPYIIVKEDK